MRLDTKKGDKVIFLGRNGYDHQLKDALEEFEIGGVYDVESVVVGGWSSCVKLDGIERKFNTVMFDNYPKEDT